MKSMLMSLLFLFQSPPAALSQGIAQTVVDHVVKVEVLALHLPITTAALSQGIAQTVVDPVVKVVREGIV
jgi:hypothetical protein